MPEGEDSKEGDRKLKVGDKFLTLSLRGLRLKELNDIMHGETITLFPVKDPKSDKSPQFRGSGIACWVNSVKEKKKPDANSESPL